jgi:hypothetical protein
MTSGKEGEGIVYLVTDRDNIWEREDNYVTKKQKSNNVTSNYIANFFDNTVYVHPKAGLSGIRMAISRTLFGSGYRMVRLSNGRDRTNRSKYIDLKFQ